MKSKQLIYRIGLAGIFIISILLLFLSTNRTLPTKTTLSPSPTIEVPFGMYKSPQIPQKTYYRIAMLGDSMTAALGPHGGRLSEILNTLYQSTPGAQRILIDNYAQGATNILSLKSQMTTKITTGDAVLDPLISQSVDLILIEPFGNNP